MILIAILSLTPPALVLEFTQQTHASHAGHDMDTVMTGALGAYPMSREASGTSWQPDATAHAMGHAQRGEWMLMGHLRLDGVYDWQEGPRVDEKAFLAGMFMGSARRDVGAGDKLALRAMLRQLVAAGVLGGRREFRAART